MIPCGESLGKSRAFGGGTVGRTLSPSRQDGGLGSTLHSECVRTLPLGPTSIGKGCLARKGSFARKASLCTGRHTRFKGGPLPNERRSRCTSREPSYDSRFATSSRKRGSELDAKRVRRSIRVVGRGCVRSMHDDGMRKAGGMSLATPHSCADLRAAGLTLACVGQQSFALTARAGVPLVESATHDLLECPPMYQKFASMPDQAAGDFALELVRPDTVTVTIQRPDLRTVPTRKRPGHNESAIVYRHESRSVWDPGRPQPFTACAQRMELGQRVDTGFDDRVAPIGRREDEPWRPTLSGSSVIPSKEPSVGPLFDKPGRCSVPHSKRAVGSGVQRPSRDRRQQLFAQTIRAYPGAIRGCGRTRR